MKLSEMNILNIVLLFGLKIYKMEGCNYYDN